MRPAIHLHTFDSDMAVAWGKAFGSADAIKIIEGDILTGTADALVSPANSFGYMDGGIDLAYRNFFGMNERAASGLHGCPQVMRAFDVPMAIFLLWILKS